MNISQEPAETIGLKALGWLAGNEDLFPVFLGSSGATVEDVKLQAQDSDFLSAVLDFMLMDDAWIMAFSSDTGIPPESVIQARAALPGGRQINWT